MRRFLTFLAAIMLTGSLLAQNNYSVIKIEKTAQRYQSGEGKWVPLRKYAELKLRDRVKVASGGRVLIVEGASGVVLEGRGEFELKELVERQQKERGLIKTVSQQLVDDAKNKRKGERQVVYGASSRGENDGNESYEKELARAIRAGEFAFLEVEKDAKDRDGLCPLIVHNGSGEVLCVNIVALSPDGRSARVLLPSGNDGGLFMAEGETRLESLVVSPDKQLRYVAFPVEGAFDGRALARYLVD